MHNHLDENHKVSPNPKKLLLHTYKVSKSQKAVVTYIQNVDTPK